MASILSEDTRVLRGAALNAPPLHSLRSCGASAAAARLVVRRVSAIARPGAPGGIDVSIFPSTSGFAPKAPFPGHTATCTSGSEYLPSLEAATRIFTQLGELLRRARRRRLLS